MKKHALFILGGTWHDFDGFARTMGAVSEAHDWSVEASYDLDRLTRLDQDNVELVLSYTCFTKPEEGVACIGEEKMGEEQVTALTEWVQAGGALLAAHASSVVGDSAPALGKLVGGVFIEHPPAFSFTVYPVYGDHPITAGIEAFTVRDEMYIEHCEPSVNIHMVTVDRGIAHPMVWSKTEGRGRVAHVAMGHSREVWDLPSYQRLMLQAIDWLTNRKPG